MGELLVQSYKGIARVQFQLCSKKVPGNPWLGGSSQPPCVLANVDLQFSRWNPLSRKTVVSRNPEAAWRARVPAVP